MPAGAARCRASSRQPSPPWSGSGPRPAATAPPSGRRIRPANYGVGAALLGRFAAEDSASSRFFAPAARDGHALFDLSGYVAARLARAGVGHIEDLGLCTYADPDRFFSYRRTTHRGEPDYGRHVNAIVLTDK